RHRHVRAGALRRHRAGHAGPARAVVARGSRTGTSGRAAPCRTLDRCRHAGAARRTRCAIRKPIRVQCTMIDAMTNTTTAPAPAAGASNRAARRRAVIEAMRAAGGGVAILPTAPERMRNRDSDYPYRWDSCFHHLTGFPEPEAGLVIVADRERGGSMLRRRAHSAGRES